MTDEVVLDSEDPSAAVDAENDKPQAEEESLPKSRVEELVKKAKLKGRDSMQAELDALKAENETLKASGGSMGGMAAPVDPDQIINAVMAKMAEKQQADSEQRAREEMEKEAQRVADTYHARMASGKETYEDFDDVMADFNPAAFPNLVYLASQVDNTPAVMYELMKNPSKWATIAVLSERDPKAAQNMLGKISASIVANEQAKANERDVAPPLSRLSSSPTGQDSGKPSSVRDFKRMFRG